MKRPCWISLRPRRRGVEGGRGGTSPSTGGIRAVPNGAQIVVQGSIDDGNIESLWEMLMRETGGL